MKAETYDVVCIGGGGAGVTAAAAAAQAGARVALVTKEPVGYGDTRISDGQMARPGIADGDGPAPFLEDMLAGGAFINQTDLAGIMARECAQATAIAEGMGFLFNRDGDGRFGAEVIWWSGGHSYPRSLLCPPAAGAAFGHALRSGAARAGIDVYEETLACELLEIDNRVQGVVTLSRHTGEGLTLLAGAVVLATGGAGWLYYPHTDCMCGATGDGIALAYDAGAELVDMEMVQFIPFAVANPHSFCGVLIGDPSVAGPGGVLLDGAGRVLFEKVHRETRSGVARIMAEAIAEGRTSANGGLFLDMSGNLKTQEGKAHLDYLNKRGRLDVVRFTLGSKAYHLEEPWEVAPSAHYFMGGVRIDSWGATTRPGLYAAGQTAGGLHGANRLGSVSLAELFVFGRRAGLAAAKYARENAPAGAVNKTVTADAVLAGGINPVKIRREIQQIMWREAGIARHESGLQKALRRLEEIASSCSSPGTNKKADSLWKESLELNFLLTVARAVVMSALTRKESRGSHYRRDYPAQDDRHWRKRTVVAGQAPGMKVYLEEAS